jgi:hypothetical protein
MSAFRTAVLTELQRLGGQADGIQLGATLKRMGIVYNKLQSEVKKFLKDAVEIRHSLRDPNQPLYCLKEGGGAAASLLDPMQRLSLAPGGGGGGGGGSSSSGGGGARAAPAAQPASSGGGGRRAAPAAPPPPAAPAEAPLPQAPADASYEELAGAAAPAPAGGAPPGTALDAALEALLAGGGGAGGGEGLGAGCTLATRAGGAGALLEASLLGVTVAAAEGAEGGAGEPVFLNVHEPFCAVMLGVQGAGKSHTLACLLEACMLPLRGDGIAPLRAPMMSLVLHFDQSIGSMCEATGLIAPNPALAGQLPPGSPTPCLPREGMLVLVSPSFYRQRKAFYGGYCEVRPLLLSWASLTADSIKRIMRIGEDENQLYVATLLSVLRDAQRRGALPDFAAFLAEVRDKCGIKGQSAPLDQRLALLEDVVRESAKNAALARESSEVRAACAPGRLVVVDLTNPLLSASEANGIFQVLVEQFRALPSRGRCGKVLALDEAHKFMDGSSEADDGLSRTIVNCARLMRHDGLRLLVSTQSPLALAPELLELASLAIVHRFHSADWCQYLNKKLPLPPGTFERIRALQPGTGLVYASRASLHAGSAPDSALLKVRVRQRLSADRGSTRANG